MGNNEIIVKQKRLPKEIKKTIVDLGIRRSDVAYLINNLCYNHTKLDLVKLVERDDIPIATQIFAHALLTDYKKGNMATLGNLMEWAFQNLPQKVITPDEAKTESELDREIQELLTKHEL